LELYYEEPQNSGKFLNIWLKHPDELNEYDYEWMIKICKSAPYDTMIAPIKSYKRLFHKKHYGVNDFIDLQMLFMLSWCGVYLRRHNETVKRFLKKEFGFNNNDKDQHVIDAGIGIEGRYRNLYDRYQGYKLEWNTLFRVGHELDNSLDKEDLRINLGIGLRY
jgi:hypothetical protein